MTSPPPPTPPTTLRGRIASAMVGGHGVAMFVLFVTPIQFFLQNLADEHPGAAWLAGGLMVAGFTATLRWAPRWLKVSPLSAPPGAVMRAALRGFRMFVGNGDVIQAVARRIDPHWKNPYPGRTPLETERYLTAMELIHWAVLVGSVPPVAAAFYYDYRVLGFAYLAANLIYNVAPNLVIRATRRRLLSIARRRGPMPVEPIHHASASDTTSRLPTASA